MSFNIKEAFKPEPTQREVDNEIHERHNILIDYADGLKAEIEKNSTTMFAELNEKYDSLFKHLEYMIETEAMLYGRGRNNG